MRAQRSFLFFAVVFCAVATAEARDIATLGAAGVPAPAFARPNRPVAAIVSPSRSTEPKRDANDEFQHVARLLELRPGMTVGDLGAGNGYFTVRLSKLLGPSGSVIAQDVSRNYLSQLGKRVDRLKLSNVKLALGEPHDPRLSPQSLEAAILGHVYHEVAEPYAFLYNLAPTLKPGARVGIVDIDKAVEQHGMPPALLRCELAAVGYREVAFHSLPGDAGYLAVFTAPEPAARPTPVAIKPCSAP